MSETISAAVLCRMFLAGAKRLDTKKEWINELNVFPVPDGDTGTNMTMTIMSAAREVLSTDQSDMEQVCKCISSGSLRGARGNSGVILSQLLRGFTKVAREYDTLDIARLSECFDKAVDTAYKAVMKPKEGTILTVAKGAAFKAKEMASAGETDLDTFMAQVIAYAEEVLEQTPEMLPVLKQAGVVDSGGQGLVEVLKGALQGYRDQGIDVSLAPTAQGADGAGVYASGRAAEIDTADIKFVYCTEFIILLEAPFSKKQEKEFLSFLESIGDSTVLVADDDLCKVHIHSNDPGLIIQRALSYGELSNMKIDNMRMEHRERLFSINYETGDYTELDAEVSGMDAELRALNESGAPKMSAPSKTAEPARPSVHKDMGFVAVCAGDGLAEIFTGLGVDVVISGGQTMNPSTADILDAVEKVDADTVFVLPNNSNIILAAEQAKEMAGEKRIIVLKSKTIPQGIAAILGYNEAASPDENEETMVEAMAEVKSAEVTHAIRDTEIDGTKIREGDYMVIGDAGILSAGKKCEKTVFDALKKLVTDESALISIYYGAEVSEEDAGKMKEKISGEYPDVDVELQYGGQPVYYYLISVE